LPEQVIVLIFRQVEWKNTNRHLFQFRECMGIKTGITPSAGPCLSSAYKVMGRELIVIVLNCESVEARYKDAEALFKWSRRKIRAF
jgi:D-alanyl-D-alanine carboxypeptidase